MLVKKYWDCVTNIGEPGNELSQPLPARIDAAVKKMASTDKVGLTCLKFCNPFSFDRHIFSVFQQFLLTGAQVEGLLFLFHAYFLD